MITREQVADLREGDVVELRDCRHPDLVTTGPVTLVDGVRKLGPWNLIGHPVNPDPWSLTVVSRAPRPLYVNHERTEPVNGDVARDDQTSELDDVWYWWNAWWTLPGVQAGNLVQGRTLRLLVDGETGQVVP